jgi:PAS domain S-box-containing protein
MENRRARIGGGFVDHAQPSRRTHATSDDRFRTIIEHAPEANFIEFQGRFAYLNPAALHLYGAASTEQLIGQSAMGTVHTDSRYLAAERIRLATGVQNPAQVSREKHLYRASSNRAVGALVGRVREVRVMAEVGSTCWADPLR